ncbi:MAG: cell division protein [Proteobacteria bacterium]|nr:cell division protein [Pseudomonadota bacterium]
MIALRSELPLKKGDASGRFVVWLVMVLVFMASIAVTTNAYIGALLGHWSQSVTGTLTIQIPVMLDANDPASTAATEKVLDVLHRHPAVENAATVPREKVTELLKPWFGAGETIADLPLPVLIDVRMSASEASAIAAVSNAVQTAAPGAVIDDHRAWLNRVIGLAEGLGAIALTTMALVTGALGLTIVFATRASLAAFAQVIDVLHVVGAKDGYIAGQFARRALLQSLLGGFAGLAIYAPTLGFIAWLASRIEDGILPDVRFPVSLWLTLAVLPLAAGAIAMITANVTVRRALSAKV